LKSKKKERKLEPQQNAYPRNKTIPALFRPLTIKGVTFKNRIFVVRIGPCDLHRD
jgi:hypothetical protein